MKKTLEAALLLMFASMPAFAQTPCTWAGQTSSIVETCGFIGIGTTAPVSQLNVVSQAGGLTRGEGTKDASMHLMNFRITFSLLMRLARRDLACAG